ncbi:MAG: riboflavin synthase, partial [Candidatus Omnitrophota bacterium]|nr:riboflavin synthase [Candidatus Omnitrophota bacterium]
MFTGVIKELGVVKRFAKLGPAYRLSLESPSIFKDAVIGDSVSVNGACLTLIEKIRQALSFDVMEETVRRSTLSGLKTGDSVNLEDS